jgi:hypothetical protein
VPLSEHEQRLLEQMERALYAEDPKFATSLRSSGPRPGSRRKAVVGVLVGIAGLALLVAGAATSLIVLGVLGFLAMLAGTVLVVSALRAPAAEVTGTAPGTTPGPAKPAAAPKSGGFMDRVEERFRKRREGEG